MSDDTTKPKSYRPKEARELLGVGKTKFCEMIRMGTIETVKVGRTRLVPVDSLHKLLGTREKLLAAPLTVPEATLADFIALASALTNAVKGVVLSGVLDAGRTADIFGEIATAERMLEKIREAAKQ